MTHPHSTPSLISPSARTIGATYLASLLINDQDEMQRIRNEVCPDCLMTGLQTQAAALALRLAGHEQISLNALGERMVAAAALRDHVELS